MKFGVPILGLAMLTGCARFHPQPISADESEVRLDSRRLDDAGLKAFLEQDAGHELAFWPLANWDLNTLTLAAFYYHPSMDLARAQWAVADAAKTTAGERPNPTVGVSPAYNTTTTVPSPWIVTPSVDIPIETAGKRSFRLAQAARLSEAARLSIASAAWKVRSAVRQSLLSLDAAQATEALMRKQQNLLAENLRLLEQQFKAGAISAFELGQARMSADSTRLALRDAERQSAEARVQLAEAIGIPTHALDGVELSFETLHAKPPFVDVQEARRQAMLNRADILGALAEYAASQSALQLEIAKQYPDINLSPGYEYDQGDNKWSLGLSVALPVFNHNQGAIAEAEARRTESAARFNALQAAVLSEIDMAVTGYHAALQKQAVADEMVGNLQRQKKFAQAMLDAGEVSKSELVAMQLQFVTAEIARREALTQARQAGGQLEDALQSPVGLPPVEIIQNSPHEVSAQSPKKK